MWSWVGYMLVFWCGWAVSCLLTRTRIVDAYDRGYDDAERDRRYTQQLRDEGII